MASQGGKSSKDGSDLVSEGSVTGSIDGSSGERRLSSSCLPDDLNEGKNISDGSGNGDSKFKKQVSEMEMMKERFARLLLGEDMSGSGKGVCPALAISNAITNLCATVFGQLWRLEPLPSEKKAMWQREMEWLLCASDHIVELKPSWQTLPDGTKHEVMVSQPRSDLIINLPALRKLDNMLLEILDGFKDTEFWYVDQGVIAPESDPSVHLWKTKDDKWWLPVPRVPPGGLSEGMRKLLSCKHDFASQILKAALSINSIALAEMEVPESYLETLPKNGRACLGDVIYRYIASENFSADHLLDCLDLSSEHIALEMANRAEAATYLWRRMQHPKPSTQSNRPPTKYSWKIVRDHAADSDKRELLAERASSVLHSLKQRFPGLTQTTLDASKIQFNKDIGQSILESYSRVLESLAFNIMARMEDVLYVDSISRQSDKQSSVAHVLSLISRKKASVPFSVPPSSTPYRAFPNTPTFSPGPLISPASTRGERTPFLRGNCEKPPRRGLAVKRALMSYLGGESRVSCGTILEGLGSISSRITEGTMTRLSMEGKGSSTVSTEHVD